MKKWSKLVLATMLSAGTLLVSGCIENLEPEGIADLRGAKAELLRAQTALQAAQAAKVEAEAALLLAQAKVQEAIAKQEEAKVAYFEAQALAEQYRAELLNIQNEEARADLEKKIADMEAAMEDAENKALIAAEKFKVEMLEVLKTLAQAQLAYDQALLDIELARNTLTSEQNAYLSSRLTTFLTLKADVVDMTRELEDAAETLAEALAAVDEAELRNVSVRAKQRKIAELKAELEGLLEAQAETEELMNLDPDLTDWDAEKEELQEQIADLEKEMARISKEVMDKMAESTAELEKLEDKIGLYVETTGYELDLDFTSDDPETWGTGLFKKVPGTPLTPIDIPEVYVPYPEFWNDFSGGSTDYFTLSPSSYTFGKEADVLANFDWQIAIMNGYDKYSYPLTKKTVETLKEDAADMLEDKDHIDVMKKYDAMVAAYKSGDFLAYANEYVYVAPTYTKEDVVETAVKDYNDALAAFEKAFNDYKTAFEASAGNQEYYDKLAKIQADEAAAKAKADADYYTARQAAQVTYSKAEADYNAAKYAHAVALRTRNRAIYDAVMTADVVSPYTDKSSVIHYWSAPGTAPDYDTAIATFDAVFNGAVTLMNAFMTDYSNTYDPTNGGSVPDKTADPVAYDQYLKDNAIYTRYVPAVDAVAKAKLAYSDPANDTDPDKSDPYDVWTKADEVHSKASGELTAAQNKAEETWNRTKKDIESEYQNKKDELDATKPVLDIQYAIYLAELVKDSSNEGAYPDLMEAISELDRILKEFFIDASSSVVDLSYDVISDLTATPPTTIVKYVFDDVLEVLVNEDKDALVPVDIKTVVALIDPEDFKKNVIGGYYDTVFDAYDGTDNIGEVLCADYPLSYPKYEAVAEYAAQKEASSSSSSRYVLDNGSGTMSGVMALYYDKLLEAAYEENTNAEYDPAAVAETVKALETARAEVEKFMKDKEAELEALRAEIEETVPALLEEVKTFVAENTALENKYDVLAQKLQLLEGIIGYYCSVTDPAGTATELETLMEALKKAYNDAVKKVADKEDEIIKAEDELQDILDGLVDAVTSAHRDYEDAQAILEMYQAMLDAATDELAKAIALIYGDEALPEDPGTEDPMPEDPGTEDPGTEDPGTEDPGTEDPGTEDPGTEDPGTGDEGGEEETPAE